MPGKLEDRSETPDALSPEWGGYESAWAVNVADFSSPLEASRFLTRRHRIFSVAAAAGIPKEMLTAFRPDKPGFEQRLHDAFDAIARTAELAAE